VSVAPGPRPLGLAKDLNKREAEKLLVEILADYNSGQYQPRVLITFKRFVDRTYAKLLETLTGSTQERYWIELRTHIFPALGDRYLQDIELEYLQGFVNHQAIHLSWNTVRVLKVILSSVYQYVVKEGSIQSNLVREVSLPRRPARKRKTLPSPAQIEALLKELPGMARVMVWLLCITGLRIGELLALRRSSIDGDQKRIYVAQTCKDGKLDSAKTESSEASVKITDEDLANLASWRRTRSHAGPDDFIFENSTGTGPVCRRNVLKRTLRPAAKRVGIDYISKKGSC